jgi:hypothetical protein
MSIIAWIEVGEGACDPLSMSRGADSASRIVSAFLAPLAR